MKIQSPLTYLLILLVAGVCFLIYMRPVQYNEKFTNKLNVFLEDEEIIDLRAGFYEKFYKIEKPYLTMKFIKDGKVVSHWAKAYRGIILKLLAKNNIQSINELMNMEIENLSIEEIKKIKLKTEIIYNIN
jgi:cytoplasmic iron level regulating protein YaaA (DUF328/UPF0246 family)